MRKILVSPGYGAGWTSWNTGKAAEMMLTYQPIIEFLEAGGAFTDEDCHNSEVLHPLLKQLQQDCGENVCVLGADQLVVRTVEGRVRIEDYDGSESVESEGAYTGWM